MHAEGSGDRRGEGELGEPGQKYSSWNIAAIGERTRRWVPRFGRSKRGGGGMDSEPLDAHVRLVTSTSRLVLRCAWCTVRAVY